MNPTKNRVRVKICGITSQQDAQTAVEAGADALGFNGFLASKRFIDLRAASVWLTKIAPFITRVAVLVNPTQPEADAVLALPGIDRVQFHGCETPEFCEHFVPHGFIKTLSAKDRKSLQGASRFGTREILLDAYVPGAFGGTGQLADWELAAEFVKENPTIRVILAGGLTPENVGAAIRTVRPYAVDVASGVESAIRAKDPIKMREFVCAVREAEAALNTNPSISA